MINLTQKKVMVKYLCIAILGLVAFSCSIQKRVHNDGYAVNWKTIQGKAKDAKVESIQQDVENQSNYEAILLEKKVVKSTELVASIAQTNQRLKAEKIQSASTQQSSGIHKVQQQHENQKQQHTVVEKVKQTKKMRSALKQNNGISDRDLLLIILALIIPFVAVGIATDWDVTKVLIALLLTFLFWIPGVIYALLVVLGEI